jgi:uncharacterized protein
MGNFEVQLLKDAKATGGALVTAFPSVGMVGSIAATYIADALKMDRIAYVISQEVPPAAIVQDGIPIYPFRVLGRDGLSIMTSEFQIPLSLAGDLATTIIKWAQESGYSMVIGLEGLMMGQEAAVAEPEKDAKVYGVGSTQRMREVLKKAGVEQFSTGMITGVSGALLSEGERSEKDIMCLLVPANAMYPDARGAARLVETLTRLLPNLELDVKELYQEAEKIEENVRATVERTKELLAAKQGQAERLGRSLMYG